jgi:hypothetical protein
MTTMVDAGIHKKSPALIIGAELIKKYASYCKIKKKTPRVFLYLQSTLKEIRYLQSTLKEI